MGSPVSPIVANMYMEYFEQKAQSIASHPRLWWQYVDDTLSSKKKKMNKTSYNTSSVDQAIQFTVENNKEDGAIPFLDTIVNPENDGKLSIAVYRKPTHMDHYIQW